MSHNTEINGRICCANCSAQLSGTYCQDCGQPAQVHRSLWHMVEELLHGILHFDNKAWRTLPALIIHPGQLTRDYIDGKRTRYMSPLILFLFLNFVIFFVFSYLGSSLIPDGTMKPLIKGGISNELHNTQARLSELEAKRLALPINDQGIKALANEIADLRLKQMGYEKSIAAMNANDVIENDTLETNNAKASTVIDSNNQDFWLQHTINQALRNPDLTFYKMKGTASKFAFILIPISLPFMWLLFIRRKDIVLFDHSVFVLYSLSFMWLLLMLVAGLARLGLSSWAWLLFLVVPPIHIFVQLRGTYQLAISSSLWRTIAIMSIALVALSAYFIVITWLSV